MVPPCLRAHPSLGDTAGVPWYDELVATEAFERREFEPLRPCRDDALTEEEADDPS